MLQKWIPKDEQLDAAENAARKSKAQKGAGAGKSGAQEGPEKLLQLPCRAEIVHYLDVRDGGWDLKECECCFDRAVSYRGQRALNMMSLEDFRSHLHKQMPDSVPAAPPNRPTRAILDHSARNPVWAVGGPRGAPPPVHYHWKCERAPYLCAEGMLVEWFAEPRVGVLMDLGKIRSRIPAILNAAGVSFPAHMDSYSAAFPAMAAALGAGRQAEQDSFASALGQILGVKERGDLKEGFGFFLQELLSGGLEKAHAEGKGRGAGRGVGGGGAGRGAARAGGGRGVEGMGMQEIMRAMVRLMEKEGGMGTEERRRLMGDPGMIPMDAMMKMLGDKDAMRRLTQMLEAESGGNGGDNEGESAGGDDGGGEGKDGNWREKLKGAAWERYVDGMGWILEHGEHSREAQIFLIDGNNANKTRVEEEAIEAARGRVGREGRLAGVDGEVGGGGGDEAAAISNPAPVGSAVSDSRLVPVNSNAVVAAFTYRAGCILQWVRIYGSDFISVKKCFKDDPHGKVLAMRHPLRDLPSLLVRLGAIPKPLEGRTFPMEWVEWPEGDEAAVKLPRDPSERCFRLGMVDEIETGDSGEGGEGGSGKGSSRQAARAGGKGKKKGGGGRGGRGGGRGNGRRRDPGEGPVSLMDALVGATAPQNRTVPIVRCTADAEFLVEFAGKLVDLPECSQCNKCFATYTFFIPTLTLIANYAYRPASVLFNRFLAVFPPHTAEFAKLLELMHMEPLPTDVPPLLNLHVVRKRAEQLPVFFLLHVAIHWPKSVLQIEELEAVGSTEGAEGVRRGAGRKAQKGKKGGKKGGGDSGEDGEDDGEVWEEVRGWCLAAMFAWKSTLRVVGPGMVETCKGNKARKAKGSKWESGSWVTGMWQRAIDPRYRGDEQEQDGQSSSSSGSGSGSSSSSEGTGKKGEVPAYLKPWPGGVNLLACLREMLLGEPCYRLASPAASSATPVASSTPAAASSSRAAVTMAAAASTVASSSAAAATAAAAAAVAVATGSAASGGRVCSAEGCGKVEGGAVKLKGCSGCGKVAYCNRDCQKAHWPSHKLTCRPKSGSKV
ncbi:unnamed protein product [Closterium sp. NIES-65]|nr:unnamed protein product [Closterium sp. NIES-65]